MSAAAQVQGELSHPVRDAATPEDTAAAIDAVVAEAEALADGQEEEEFAGEDELAQPSMVLLIQLPNGKSLKIHATPTDCVMDVRTFIMGTPDGCDLTCYHLEHNGEVLNDYVELSECPSLSLEDTNTLKVVCDFYDERRARQHVRRVRQLLVEPPATMQSGEIPGAWEQEAHAVQVLAQAKVRQETELDALKAASSSSKRGGNKRSSMAASTGGKAHQLAATQNAQNAALQAASAEFEALKQSSETFEELRQSFDLAPLTPLQYRPQTHAPCVHQLAFSAWNPPPGNRRLQGDLFYLEVLTLENQSLSITASVDGFFVNRSTLHVFDPSPAVAPYMSHSLVQLLRKASPAFEQQFTRLINREVVVHPFDVLEAPSNSMQPWTLVPAPQRVDWNRAEDALMSNFGQDDRGVTRDWNEEYQSCRDLPNEDLQQRTTRDRMLFRVYSDFVDAATKGAMAIVHGNIPSVNPMEDNSTRVYIYNDIFFSFAVDDHIAAMDNLFYQQLRTQDIERRKQVREQKLAEDPQAELTEDELVETHIPPRKSDLGWSTVSFSQANHDINGVRLVNLSGQAGLYTVATVLVSYCGKRVIAQSIIPGIFHTDSSSGHKYGSMDHGNVVKADEEFHALVTKVAEDLSLKTHEVLDGEGNSVQLACSVETKGIRGADGRFYLLDLIHMTPRDLNFPDPVDHANHLLRPELVSQFTRHKAMEQLRAKRAAEKADEPEAESKEAPEAEAKEDQTPEEKVAADKAKMEKRIQKNEERAAADREAFNAFVSEIRFNPDVGREARLPEDSEDLQKDVALVQEASKFLVEMVLPALVRALKVGEAAIVDSVSLKRCLHEAGVNLRYLGQLTRLCEQEQGLGHISKLLVQEMVIRASKHLLYQVLDDSSSCKTLWGRRGGGSFGGNRGGAAARNAPFSARAGGKGRVRPGGTPLSLGHEMSGMAQDIAQFLSSLLGAHAGGVALSPQEVQAAERVLGRLEDQQARQMQDLLHHQLHKRQIQAEVLNSIGMGSWVGNPESAAAPTFTSSMMEEGKENQLEAEPEAPIRLSNGAEAPTDLHSPANLWLAVRKLVKTKFDYELPAELRFSPREKFQILRGLSIQCGLQLASRQYDLRNLDEFSAAEREHIPSYAAAAAARSSEDTAAAKKRKTKAGAADQYRGAFLVEDVLGCVPVVKSCPPKSQDGTELLRLGRQMLRRGALEQALQLLNDALNVNFSVYGPMHPDTAVVFENLAQLYSTARDFERAVDHQQRATIIHERTQGLDHPSVAAAHNTLAMYLHAMGNLDGAKYHVKRALFVYELIAGPEHPDTAHTHTNLALIYMDSQNLEKAYLHFEQALKRFKTHLGENSPAVAMCYHHLAAAHHVEEKFGLAADIQKKCLDCWTASAGPDHPGTREAQNWFNHFKMLAEYAKKLPPGMTMQTLQALASAGGLTKDAQQQQLQQQQQQQQQLLLQQQQVQGQQKSTAQPKRRIAAAGAVAAAIGATQPKQALQRPVASAGPQIPGQMSVAQMTPEELAAQEARARKRREKKKRQKDRKRGSKDGDDQ